MGGYEVSLRGRIYHRGLKKHGGDAIAFNCGIWRQSDGEVRRVVNLIDKAFVIAVHTGTMPVCGNFLFSKLLLRAKNAPAWTIYKFGICVTNPVIIAKIDNQPQPMKAHMISGCSNRSPRMLTVESTNTNFNVPKIAFEIILIVPFS